MRAFALKRARVAYGEGRSFKTLPPVVPSVITLNISAVGETSAVAGGNVTSDVGAVVTQKGIVYGTIPNKTLNNSFTQNEGGVGSFTNIITGLMLNTTY